MENHQDNHLDSSKGNVVQIQDKKSEMSAGIFINRSDTEKAYDELQKMGYTMDEINAIMTQETHKNKYDQGKDLQPSGTKTAKGAGLGSAIGGAIGAIFGIVVGLGTSVIIPGLGIVVAGSIAAGLAGAGAGGISGTLIGALIGAGNPDHKANLVETEINNGLVIMGLHPQNDEDAKFFNENWSNHNHRGSWL